MPHGALRYPEVRYVEFRHLEFRCLVEFDCMNLMPCAQEGPEFFGDDDVRVLEGVHCQRAIDRCPSHVYYPELHHPEFGRFA